MNFSFTQQTAKRAKNFKALAATLVLGCAFGAVTQAGAQVTPPTTPDKITAPAGNTASW